jgi:hypothetical protein
MARPPRSLTTALWLVQLLLIARSPAAAARAVHAGAAPPPARPRAATAPAPGCPCGVVAKSVYGDVCVPCNEAHTDQGGAIVPTADNPYRSLGNSYAAAGAGGAAALRQSVAAAAVGGGGGGGSALAATARIVLRNSCSAPLVAALRFKAADAAWRTSTPLVLKPGQAAEAGRTQEPVAYVHAHEQGKPGACAPGAPRCFAGTDGRWLVGGESVGFRKIDLAPGPDGTAAHTFEC